MSGDYTRLTFRPRRNHAGVLMQQGRVTLDADWNEMSELLDRRWRAETMDIVGRGVVPRTDLDADLVPSGFRILVSGASFTIGKGRAYVDGLLAENHGDLPERFDAVLAESRGTALSTYESQPWLPLPPALPALPPASNRHLVYLDVWQREVTAVGDPLLLEKAIGVDTTTRLQTIWQVRVLPNVGADVTCATDSAAIPGWTEATRSSGGRLTTGVVVGVASADPCVIAEAGGFRGTENRLYRVEVHTPGAPGTARFKWSRDNASVVSAVTAIDPAQPVVRVARIGRDETLRFKRGDWVEITHDVRELHGVPGELRQIVADPDEVEQSLRLSAPLTIGTPTQAAPHLFDSSDPAAFHTRVKLWHQAGVVRDTTGSVVADLTAAGADGTIPVPSSAATEIVLEDGVKVAFSLDAGGGAFKSGDHWVFAARTVDGSVEPLAAAPPRGIHHHYLRLGVVTANGVLDCREFWPPEGGEEEGCCTAVVFPGEDIQAAIDGLPEAGGCVCLKAGIHSIEVPIRIDRSRVLLHGESPGTKVVFSSGVGGLHVGMAQAIVTDVAVHDIELSGSEALMAVFMQRCTRVRMERCTIAGSGSVGFGIALSSVGDVDIADNTIGDSTIGVLLDEAPLEEPLPGELLIRGNRLAGATTRAPTGAPLTAGEAGVRLLSDIACRVEDNVVRGFATGVELRGGRASSLIAGNRILRGEAEGATDVKEPLPLPQLRDYLSSRGWAIVSTRVGCVIRANEIDLASPRWGGIRVAAPRASIVENRLTGPTQISSLAMPGSIYCHIDPASQSAGADEVDVRENLLHGPQTGIVLSGVRDARVADNRIWGGIERQGWYGVVLDDTPAAVVSGNTVSSLSLGCFLQDGEHNRILDNHIVDCSRGIFASGESDLEITGNEVRACALFGIATALGKRSTIARRNRIFNCSWASSSLSGGLLIFLPGFAKSFDLRATIESCEVVDTGISPDGTEISTGIALGILVLAPEGHISGNRVTYSGQPKLNAELEHRALLFESPTKGRMAQALVVDNVFKGWGRTHLVEIGGRSEDLGFESIGFSNNSCEHFERVVGTGDFKARPATVRMDGDDAIAMGNFVRSAGRLAMNLTGCNRVALVGNIGNDDYLTSSAPRPAVGGVPGVVGTFNFP